LAADARRSQTQAGGHLILVVGPSGAGKDTVLRAAAMRLAGRDLIRFPNRVITRPSAHASEDADLMSVADYELQRQAGRFMLAWSAHGLQYGIPNTVLDDLKAGCTILINVSRGVVARAEAIWPATHVVLLTASPEILAARIAARGRESVDEISSRLARDQPLRPPRSGILEIRNDGTIDAAADRLAGFVLSLVDASAS
jgi:ribose 1,5-bisphosphokinase